MGVGAVRRWWWSQYGDSRRGGRLDFRISPTGTTAVMHPELTTMPDLPAESWQAAIDISL